MREVHVVIWGNHLVAGLGSQIAVGQAVIASRGCGIAVVPEPLDESGGVAHLGVATDRLLGEPLLIMGRTFVAALNRRDVAPMFRSYRAAG